MKAKDKNERHRGTQKRKGKYKEIIERREETKEKKKWEQNKCEKSGRNINKPSLEVERSGTRFILQAVICSDRL